MVRFRRNRWYSASGQQELRARTLRESTTPTYQLVRLFVLLAVVVVVMRQAADPKIYDRFFGTFTTTKRPIPESNSISSQSSGTDKPVSASSAGEKPITQLAKEQIWQNLLKDASPAEIDVIGRRLFASPSQSDEAREINPLSKTAANVLSERLNSWVKDYEAAGLADSSNAKLLHEFIGQWPIWETWFGSRQATLPSELSEEAAQALRDAMDNLLIGTLRDGSQWRTVEHAAFSRSIQLARERAHQSTARPGPIVETLLLDGEIETYRGRWVRFRGSVARGPEKHVATSPEFGTVEYWVMWLRPLDMSNQPVCVYFALEPPSVPLIDAKANPNEPISWVIEVDARVLKKLAYASQGGIDVAPVLMAASARWIRDGEMAGNSESKVPLEKTMSVWAPPSRDLALARALKLFLEKPLRDLTPASIDRLASDNQLEPNLAILQLIYQLRRQPEVIERLANVPDQLRMEIPLRTVQGWTQKIETIPLSEDIQDWFDNPTLYRVTLESFPTDALPAMQWIIFSAHVPEFWRSKESPAVHQPVTANGLVLDATGDMPSLLLVPDLDWSWTSDRQEDQFVPKVPAYWSRFGNRGWNLSQLDALPSLQTKPLASTESQAIFTLLELTPQIAPMEYAPIIETLKRPNDFALRDTKTTVNVIRIARVSVTDQNESNWLLGSSYYQIDGMASLGNERVEITGGPNVPKIEFEGEYPVTFVTKDLPKWLTSTDGLEAKDPYRSQEASDIWYPHVTADIDGVFYRLWGYTSQAIESHGESARQFGPLVFVRSLTQSQQGNSTAIRNQLNGLTAFVLLAIVGVVWTAIVLNRRRTKTRFSLPSQRDRNPKAKE